MAKSKDLDSMSRPLDRSALFQRIRESYDSRIRYILIIFFLVLGLTLLASYLAFNQERFEEIPTCGDGTFYNSCSIEKPYFCEDGVLLEKASLCGCGDSISESNGDFCSSQYNTGHLDLTFNYVLEGREGGFDYTVFEGVDNHVSSLSRVISFEGEEIISRYDFKYNSINDEIQRENIEPLVKRIQNLAPNDEVQQARIAISIVQNIPYGRSNETDLFERQEINHSRYPYEVLFDNQGICGEKSGLMALLLKELGFGVSIFYFQEENHEAVGIKCPVDQSLYGSGYCFVETGGPAILTDSSLEFEGGISLESTPEVIIISSGLSLPENLPEYRDADLLEDIRERNFKGILNLWRHDNLMNKYGLNREVFRLD